MLKDLKVIVLQHGDEIDQHRDLFIAILNLVDKLEYVKSREDTWEHSFNVPHTIEY